MTDESTDEDRAEDPLAAAGLDPDPPVETTGGFPSDPELRDLLRAVGDDVRGESSESKQLAAIIYRVSDLYDSDEETSPEEIYRNVRHIMRVKSQGGLRK